MLRKIEKGNGCSKDILLHHLLPNVICTGVVSGKGTIHLRRQQIFMIFDPYPPPVGSFLLVSISKLGHFLTPFPLKNADVLNGWAQS